MDEQPPPIADEIFVTLAGEVNQQMSSRVLAGLIDAMRRGVKTIHLLIQSYGGNIGDGVGIYNFIRNLPVEVITYNGGMVASVAVIIFLSGKKRRASETGTFVIHKAHHTLASATADQLELVVGGLKIEDTRLEKILKDSLTLSEEQWKIHQRGNLTLTAQAALDAGLIHEVADFVPTNAEQLFHL